MPDSGLSHTGTMFVLALALALPASRSHGAELPPLPPDAPPPQVVQPVPDASLVPGLDPQAPPLDIATALHAASVNNMQTEIAEANIESSLAMERQAYSLLYPTLTASGGYSTVSSSDSPFGASPAQTTNGTVQVSLNIFNAAAFPGVTAAKRNLQAQRYTSRELERTLAFNVARGFLVIIATEQLLDAGSRRLAVSRQTVIDAKSRAGAGLASQNDATRALLTQATAQLTLTSDAQSVSSSRLALAQLIGLPVVGPIAVAPDIVVPGRDEATLEILALKNREDLASLRLQVEAQRKLALSERLGLVPEVSVVGSYADRNVTGNASLSAGILPAGDPVWTVGINANWTIYDGGMHSSLADGYTAAARQIYAQYLDQCSILHRDLSTALLALASAEAAIVQSGVQVEVARTNSREIQARSAQGLATALDVADAIASQFEAEADYVHRAFTLQTDRLQLRSLVGYWPTSNDALPGTVSDR